MPSYLNLQFRKKKTNLLSCEVSHIQDFANYTFKETFDMFLLPIVTLNWKWGNYLIEFSFYITVNFLKYGILYFQMWQLDPSIYPFMKFPINVSFNDISNYRLLLVRAIILGNITIITIITDFDIKIICYLYKKFSKYTYFSMHWNVWVMYIVHILLWSDWFSIKYILDLGL